MSDGITGYLVGVISGVFLLAGVIVCYLNLWSEK